MKRLSRVRTTIGNLGFSDGAKTRNLLNTINPTGWNLHRDDVIDPSLSAGPWFYLAFTYDGLAGKQWNFENGMPLGTSPHTIGAGIIPNKNNLWLGGGIGEALTKASIDEIRVERVFRSADWIWASYMTVVSNSVFSSYEVSIGGNEQAKK